MTDDDTKVGVGGLSVLTGGIIFLGITVMFTAVHYLSSVVSAFNIEATEYIAVKFVLCSVLMLFAATALKNRLLTMGILMLVCSSSSMIFTVSMYSNEASSSFIADLFFAITLLISTAIFATRKEYLMMAASAVFSVTILAPQFMTGQTAYTATGVMLVIAGALYALKGVINTFRYASGEELRYSKGCLDYSDKEYAVVLISAAGMVSFTIVTVMTGVNVVSDEISNNAYQIALMVLSAVSLCFSVFALMKDMVAPGIMIFVGSMTALVSSVSMITCGDPALYFGLLMVSPLLALIYIYYRNRQFVMSAIVILMTLSFVMTPVSSDLAVPFRIVVMMTRILIGYFAVSEWIYFETGKHYLPKNMNGGRLTKDGAEL